MSLLKRALSRFSENVKDDGLTGVKLTAYDYYVGALMMSGLYSRVDSTNVFEEEWDVLVLLDCARPEFISEVEDEYEFLESGASESTLVSVGSSSEHWLENTFVDTYADEISETAYVTANPNSERTVSSSQFALLDEVWRDEWDPDLQTIPAEAVTDRAIEAARENDFDRLILHYMQPHPPFVPDMDIDAMRVTPPDKEEAGSNMRDLVLKDGYEPSTLWDAHVENLRYVLDSLEVLLRSLDADSVIISADHGQAFGSWGLYGHPSRVPLPALYTVPWVEVSATDTGEYVPDPERRATQRDEDLDSKLEALGYRT
ncbi:hypothetical protein [Haloarchaeobius sp. HME9146]|uniref:hypothetical protein n=1 Tax=Haloarchaeobius sp. HME9146 TaxID=2978732 RepID=UPI0021C0337E|nr:hypothetical protein [Haloarchaeobius sp. HME9146]MCT9097030.1 hypothetical protein [Haloarchaeobius sp. HME9146]